MFRPFTSLVAIILLTGCVTLPDVPKETLIPVGVPCLTADQVPQKPDFITDAQLAAKPDGQFVLSLASDRLARVAYIDTLEATLSGCVSTKSAPEPVKIENQDARPWWRIW